MLPPCRECGAPMAPVSSEWDDQDRTLWRVWVCECGWREETMEEFCGVDDGGVYGERMGAPAGAGA